MTEGYKEVAITDMTFQPRRVESGERVAFRAVLTTTGRALDLEDYLYHYEGNSLRTCSSQIKKNEQLEPDRFGIIRGQFAQDEEGCFFKIRSFEDLTPDLIASMPKSVMERGKEV